MEAGAPCFGRTANTANTKRELSSSASPRTQVCSNPRGAILQLNRPLSMHTSAMWHALPISTGTIGCPVDVAASGNTSNADTHAPRHSRHFLLRVVLTDRRFLSHTFLPRASCPHLGIRTFQQRCITKHLPRMHAHRHQHQHTTDVPWCCHRETSPKTPAAAPMAPLPRARSERHTHQLHLQGQTKGRRV
jgi:hypothetical protein